MRYLFDTNVLSELRKEGARGNPKATAWTTDVVPTETAISVITILEIARGIAILRRRDPVQAGAVQAWLDDRIERFQGRILTVDTPVAQAAAQLHVPDPRPELDSLIAATAIVHGLTVVTRNVKDFEPMGVPIINPWES